MMTPAESEELERHLRELEKLKEEMGLVGMIRHLQRTIPGSGDYTAERHALIGHLTLDDIMKQVDAVQRRERDRERQPTKE